MLWALAYVLIPLATLEIDDIYTILVLLSITFSLDFFFDVTRLHFLKIEFFCCIYQHMRNLYENK